MSVVACTIIHVATGKALQMPLIIQNFDYDISPKFNRTEVYGRMDPIFTYQNTTRKFTAKLATPGGRHSFSYHQRKELMSTGLISRLDFVPDKRTRSEGPRRTYTLRRDITRRYMPKIADLFKLMYPLYNNPTNSGVGFLQAPPLLRIKLGGATERKNLLFVPENFKVSSLVDGSSIGVGNNGFDANASGYTITLGGTILHENSRVGMQYDGDKIIFGQGVDFPFDTGGRANLFTTDEFCDPAEVFETGVIVIEASDDPEDENTTPHTTDEQAEQTGQQREAGETPAVDDDYPRKRACERATPPGDWKHRTETRAGYCRPGPPGSPAADAIEAADEAVINYW